MISIFKIKIDNNRVFGLDLLRAFAIIFVLIEHGSYLLPKEWRHVSNLFVFDGVSMFFVLSGFLIGGVLIKLIQEKGISKSAIEKFWIRRWYRTLPTYFLILFTLCLLHLLFNERFNVKDVSGFFIFSQNLFTKHPSRFFPEAWCLSVEEWFYLILPLLIAILTTAFNKMYKKGVLFSCLIVIVSVTMFRYFRYSNISISNINDWDLLFRKQVATRLDSLMFGVLGAYLSFYRYELWIKHKKAMLLTGLSLLVILKFIVPVFFTVDGIYACVFSFTAFSLATLLLLPYLSELKAGKTFLVKAVTYISLTSYSMYLLNLSIVQLWIINKIPWHNLIHDQGILVVSKYCSYWFLVILLSVLLYKYFESPITSLRDKIK